MLARLGVSPEDALVFWNRGFTGHDHQMWRVWEDLYGARDAVIMYSRVWEGFALGFLDVIKSTINMQEFKTTDDLAKLNRAYWEAIGCEVEEVEHTPDRLVTLITTCPYFDNMVDMYGKEAASEMMKKTIGPTSANYYQTLMKAIGLWDTFFVTQDQFRSLGDSVCRMVYVRRSAMTDEAPETGGVVKCFVTFRLKPGVTVDEYLEWFHRENVPAVRQADARSRPIESGASLRRWRGTRRSFVEEMEIDDQAHFERELEEVPEMAAMLEGWYSHGSQTRWSSTARRSSQD